MSIAYQRLDERSNIQQSSSGYVVTQHQPSAPYAPGYAPNHSSLYPVLTPAPTAVPIQAFPSVPQPHVAVATPAAPYVTSHIEPAYMSCAHRFILATAYGMLLTIFGFNLYFFLFGVDDQYVDDGSQAFLMIYCGIMLILLPILFAIKIPRRLELTPNCIVLHTTFVSHSIAYERITAVEMIPSLWCWFGTGCSFPKGNFTAFRNGLFIRSADCGQSIVFTPTDMERIVAHMRMTPLANRVVRR